jgi:hypothetical protein
LGDGAEAPPGGVIGARSEIAQNISGEDRGGRAAVDGMIFDPLTETRDAQGRRPCHGEGPHADRFANAKA